LSSSAETRGGFFRDDTVATSSRSSTDGASSSRRDDLDASGSRTRLEASADDRFRSATSQSAGGFFAAADAEDSALDTTIEDVLALDQDPYL
jgi:hypothetical protein